MSTEQALRDVLAAGNQQGEAFRRQLESFREFEQKLEAGGYAIQRETFSIPLMERIAPCIYPGD